MSDAQFLAAVMRGLMVEFAAWIAMRPRTYAEAMEAWGTHCPGLPVWEDARDQGLVQIVPRGRLADAEVSLTEKGRALAALA